MSEEKKIDETVPGGSYIVGGQTVDANGNPVKGGKSATVETDDAPDFSKMTKAELIAHADENGVEGVYETMTKAEIIEQIEGK